MSETDLIRVLIADDEPLGRQRIEHLLDEVGGIRIVGHAADGDVAVDAIRRLEPDLVFLDIAMPKRTGLDVVRAVGPDSMPVTIFITAYDDHALEAFELAATDYLVKPFSDERFEQALRRARRRIELEEMGTVQKHLRTLIEQHALAPAPAPERASAAAPYLKRIAVQKRGQIRVVPVSEIDYISASGVYVELHVGNEGHLVRTSLRSLEKQLDPEHFFRIHRTEIVQLDRVELLLKEGGGSYRVQIRSGAMLPVGRSRIEELERRLGRIEADRN